MSESWWQFSLYPPEGRNRFQPLQVLYGFLPEFIKDNPSITRWHLLFEPSALIRFRAEDKEMAFVWLSAMQLAERFGLVFEEGDCSSEFNNELPFPGKEYGGEVAYYGEELWDANQKFMQACGEASMAMAKLSHKEQVRMIRKFRHLFCNIMGLNYLEEMALGRIWSDRSAELYQEYGRS